MKTKLYRIILILLSIGPTTLLSAELPDSVYPREINLESYLTRVATGNLDYISEKYNVRMAEAEVILQRIFPDPSLTFEAADDCYSLELGYTLELGKRKSRIEMAKSAAEVEKLATEWFFQELRAEATSIYIETIFERELMDLKKDSYKYMSSLARFDSLRYVSGEINAIDARQSSLEASVLLNEFYQQEGDYLSSVTELNLYMGDVSMELFSPVGNIEKIDRTYSLPTLINLGIENRIDLLAADKELDLAYRNLKNVKAERRPDIDVSVGYEKDWRGSRWKREMLTAGVSVPLSFSNLNKGALKQAEYYIEQNRNQTLNKELQIQIEISQAYYQYEALRKQVLKFNSGILDDAEKFLEGMTFRYKRGETAILDVLMAQRTYNEIRQEYLERLKEYALSIVEIQKRCGIWDITL